MMVDDISKKRGGLLGKEVEAIVVDPASNWPLFAEKARDLLSLAIWSPPISLCSAARLWSPDAARTWTRRWSATI
jgi:hypothetical protein